MDNDQLGNLINALASNRVITQKPPVYVADKHLDIYSYIEDDYRNWYRMQGILENRAMMFLDLAFSSITVQSICRRIINDPLLTDAQKLSSVNTECCKSSETKIKAAYYKIHQYSSESFVDFYQRIRKSVKAGWRNADDEEVVRLIGVKFKEAFSVNKPGSDAVYNYTEYGQFMDQDSTMRISVLDKISERFKSARGQENLRDFNAPQGGGKDDEMVCDSVTGRRKPVWKGFKRKPFVKPYKNFSSDNTWKILCPKGHVSSKNWDNSHCGKCGLPLIVPKVTDKKSAKSDN